MKGLYIHIPFCKQKCKYCDFTSFSHMEKEYDKYLDVLLSEMKLYQNQEVDTIFIGGGTPTMLNSVQLKKLIKACFENFKISSDYEFTVESNPGTLDEDKIKVLLNNGVNRISVGVQSFNDVELKKIGRIHDSKVAYNTIYQLKKLGFSNINIDLMMSLPSQTKESFIETLKTAVSLDIPHISCYSLIIEENTPLEMEYKKGKLILPTDDEDRDMYAYSLDFFCKNGFEQYEISNFSKQNFRCRHNIKYWKCNEYIGLGASAHSYINGIRFCNTSNINEYLIGNFSNGEKEILTKNDMQSEFMMMGLRMNEGISEQDFFDRFLVKIDDVYGKELKKFTDGGFLIYKDGRYTFSNKGRDVSNSILCEFMLN